MSTAPASPSPKNRPFLVGTGPAPLGSYSPLTLWHLLSLDAPTVAAVWTAFAAWCFGVRISVWDPLAMLLAVWILYAADRLLDAKPLFDRPFLPGIEERHRFHHKHRSRFLAVILLVTLPLLMLLHRSDEAELHLFVLLACLLSGWFLVVHARHTPSAEAHTLPKELAVGLFFPAAVFIPTVARAPALRAALVPFALSMAALCTLNCLFLYAWEHANDRSYGHRTTRWASQHVAALTLTLLLVGGLFLLGIIAGKGRTFLHPFGERAHPADFPLACCVSGMLLLVLHSSRRRCNSTTLRALADFVLLTPVPIWLLQHVLGSSPR